MTFDSDRLHDDQAIRHCEEEGSIFETGKKIIEKIEELEKINKRRIGWKKKP